MDAELEKMTELRHLRRRVLELQRDRLAAETVAAETQRACRREIRGMAAFMSVGACLVAATVCLIAAPWWTAVAPLLLALGVLKRAGW